MKGQDLMNAVRAGFTFFYAQTDEMDKTVKSIKEEVMINDYGYEAQVWDFENNLDPESCLYEMLEKSQPKTVVVAKNFHWFLKDEYGALNKQFITFILNRLELFASTEYRKVFIIVASEPFEKAIPEILQKDFHQVKFDLPNNEEITELLDYVIESVKDKPKFQMPTEDEMEQLVLSSRGLTKRHIVANFSYALIKDDGKLSAKRVAEFQARDIEKTAGLKIGEYNKSFDTLKGMEQVKYFTTQTIKSPLSKGIILLGPAGTGKTHFSQCLGFEANMKVIEMEMAQMMGEGLVGQAQNAMRNAIEVIKANAPCVLFIDEIEKGLAGAGSKVDTDGGTTKQSMGQFLKFLSNEEEREGVYVVATCNDISSLPPEWLRAERWDGIFFIDLPNEYERDAIYRHYTTEYNVDDRGFDGSKMEGWSGAEIKTCCRLAKMMNTTCSKSSEFVIPISKTMRNEIESLRKWADGKTIPASKKIKPIKRVKREIEI